jgi:predicted dehydrogenase
MEPPKLKVALVGCGQIADAHLQEIRKLAGAGTIAVCDRHDDLARQAAARFGVPGVFNDLARMLAEARPDVLHVTTPPRSHRPIALKAIGAGVHVYIEKPFSLDASEADEILDAARDAGLLVCVGHDQLYDPAWRECRQLIDEGRLGRVVHIESIQGYDLGGPFGRAIIGDRDHWVRGLPGGLFQNVMSHALYRITDLLTDPEPGAWAAWSGDETASGLPTELRASIHGGDVTGNLVFTSAARPVQRVTRVFGTRGGVEVDPDSRVLRQFTKAALPGAFAKIETPLRQWSEATRSSLRNVGRFLRSDLHYFAGMRSLFEEFYRAIATGGPPPIAPGEIRRVTALMDAIFASCRRERTRPGTSSVYPVGAGVARGENS